MERVLLLSKLFDAGRKLIDGKVNIIEHFTNNPYEALDEIAKADCILIGNQKFDEPLFKEAKNLKILAKQGSGTDNVDLKAAEKYGIKVITSPGTNAKAVAEHVMMLVLAAERNLYKYDKAVRTGNFAIRSTCEEKTIENKTIGLIGFGRIGKEVATFAKTFGMDVIIYDPYITGECGEKTCPTLKELCTNADVISIHVPLNQDTKNLISDREFSWMKDGAVLINCARGGIVDEAALYKALSDRKLHAAGLDVFAIEPAIKDNPLFTLDNIVVTPHSAALTKESSDSMSLIVAESILKEFRK